MNELSPASPVTWFGFQVQGSEVQGWMVKSKIPVL